MDRVAYIRYLGTHPSHCSQGLSTYTQLHKALTTYGMLQKQNHHHWVARTKPHNDESAEEVDILLLNNLMSANLH